MKKLFIDTNIVIDLLSRREPFYEEVDGKIISQGKAYTPEQFKDKLAKDKIIQDEWIKENIYKNIKIGGKSFEDIKEKSQILQMVFPSDESELVRSVQNMVLLVLLFIIIFHYIKNPIKNWRNKK